MLGTEDEGWWTIIMLVGQTCLTAEFSVMIRVLAIGVRNKDRGPCAFGCISLIWMCFPSVSPASS